MQTSILNLSFSKNNEIIIYCIIIQSMALNSKSKQQVLIVILVILVLLLWAEMGVGVFGSPISGD